MAASVTQVTANSHSQHALGLASAFELFNQLSTRLAQSYGELEGTVSRLNAELACARQQRIEETMERERISIRMAHLLDVFPAGVIVLNGRGEITEANPAARALLGESITGSLWRDVVARAFRNTPDGTAEQVLRDGRRVDIQLSPLGSEPGQILLLQDVTEKVFLQEQLRRHERLRSMGELSARLAHQVRTPLAAARLYVSRLDQKQLSDEHRLRVAGKLNASLRQLEQLVNDMLSFARGGRAGAETVALEGLVTEAAQSLDPLLESWQATLAINMAPGLTLQGDRQALLGVLQNLITNAVQAGAPGQQVRLEVRDESDTVVMEIIDSGRGMPGSEQARIFEPFFTTRSQGTGLGLSVVRNTIDAHRGTIEIDSVENHGTTFRIRLPRAGCGMPVAGAQEQ
jgi:two-component system sensor histidine kinase FlrB